MTKRHCTNMVKKSDELFSKDRRTVSSSSFRFMSKIIFVLCSCSCFRSSSAFAASRPCHGKKRASEGGSRRACMYRRDFEIIGTMLFLWSYDFKINQSLTMQFIIESRENICANANANGNAMCSTYQNLNAH